jgi:hypothetical protein
MNRASSSYVQGAIVLAIVALSAMARGQAQPPPAGTAPKPAASGSAVPKAKAPSKVVPVKNATQDKPSLKIVKVPIADFAAHKTSVANDKVTFADKPPAGACMLVGKDLGDSISVELKFPGESCGPLRGNPPTKGTVSAKIAEDRYASFELVPAATFESGATFFLETNGEVITTDLVPGPSKTIIWYDNGDWFSASLGVEANPSLPQEVARWLGSAKQQTVLVNFDAAATTSGHTQTTLTQVAPEKPRPRRDWCRHASGKFNGYTVCIDLYSSVLDKRRRQVQILPEGTNHILRPNRAMRVLVLHPKDATVSIALGGEEGIFVPADRNLVAESKGEQHSDRGEKKRVAEPDFAIEEQEFGPRLPGTANLTVTTKRPNQEDQTRVVEFLVEQTYLGAVRLGISAVFGGAVDRGYEARSVGGARQAEIVATSTEAVNLEVVLGYSAYLTPRSYANTNWFRFEPYVGIGVLNDSPTGIQTLKSLYAGIEWEPTPNFAIALTGVARRVTRLQNGLRVGSPVTGEVPTAQTIGLGAGLVFNLSPEFFRVARSPGSSFFE